ncbi:MAG: DUF3098 domain-containing protein [Saprospiraceae bacterium]|nr:DUF3098 domain-containing protein [Candidatus Vicinibacter affinis]MBP6173263.1 DUF3098 domain-containing protein [Saprospiraceae bacterium]MBK6572241.1 DUF3098 domain-containing protein [Candidatus Vicinibacter affinis]MBK6824209.1 DUF3098 domain-containing protein [Candidatus Vicinibacter affinis]MBK7303826.1 DUF3098 domain-containing protein [Candidatus Vicinibacter affinis]
MGESKSKKAPIKSETAYTADTQKVLSSLKRKDSMSYGKAHIQIVLIGLGLIALGLLLMSGGWMPSPDVWDESIIYSTRRTVIAPIFIIAGLAMQVYAIFKD